MSAEVFSLAISHLRISLLAIALGICISMPLALAASRRPRVERITLAFASVVQTIPGLALLAAMVPALVALGAFLHSRIPSIGELPAVLALSVYAVLPLLRGAVLGISGVDRAVVEAADAVGMTKRQRLRLVELPLAMPHLVGGLRTATVWTVGTATLATPIGARSLGELIFSGLQTRHYDEVLAGCVGSAVLAIALDSLLRLAESSARKSRPTRNPALGALVAMMLWAIGSTAFSASASNDTHAVRIGAKTFTEQRVLAAALAATMTAQGERPTISASLGTTVAFDALVHGDLEMYVEYTGTIWTTLMGKKDAPLDRAAMNADVVTWLEREKGVAIAATLGFENAYALVVRDASGDRRISDLGAADGEVLGTDYEFLSRPEWAALKESYGLRFKDRRPMDPSLLYDALANGSIDVATGYTTDARIDSLKLRPLVDDRGAIPPYDAVVLTTIEWARAHPTLIAALKKLDGTIDAKAMRAASASVDRDGATPAQAALMLLR
jgi:osmoprotectant transport system permease protein